MEYCTGNPQKIIQKVKKKKKKIILNKILGLLKGHFKAHQRQILPPTKIIKLQAINIA